MARRPQTLSNRFESQAEHWGKVAERNRQKVELAEARERGGVIVTGSINIPRWMKYTLVPLAAVGSLSVAGLAGFGAYKARQEAEVQGALSASCSLSPELGNIAAGACINTTSSRIPLVDKSQTRFIHDAVEYVSDAGDAYAKGIQPEGSGALFVTWEAKPTGTYAETYQSIGAPAETVTVGGLIDGLSNNYKQTGNKDLYNACLADNAARVAVVRANAEEYAQGAAFTAEMIQDPTIVLDPHEFAPYVNTDGKLFPPLPEGPHREIISQDSAGNQLICPVPKG